jgi:hypothetical protein
MFRLRLRPSIGTADVTAMFILPRRSLFHFAVTPMRQEFTIREATASHLGL